MGSDSPHPHRLSSFADIDLFGCSFPWISWHIPPGAAPEDEVRACTPKYLPVGRQALRHAGVATSHASEGGTFQSIPYYAPSYQDPLQKETFGLKWVPVTGQTRLYYEEGCTLNEIYEDISDTTIHCTATEGSHSL